MKVSIDLANKNYINIEDTYIGGPKVIFDSNDSLKDFSKYDSDGFLVLNDLLIYELRKFKDSWGTFPKDLISLEEYVNLLRNHISSRAYRFMGFISVDSMSTYIKQFANYRRINIQAHTLRDISSKKIFLSFINEALKNDHPLILQKKRKNSSKLPKYISIIGLEDEILYCSVDGKLVSLSINEVFDFTDKEIGLMYISVG